MTYETTDGASAGVWGHPEVSMSSWWRVLPDPVPVKVSP